MTQNQPGWGRGHPPAFQAPRRPDEAQPRQHAAFKPRPQNWPHLLPSTLRGTKTLHMQPPPPHQGAPQEQIHLTSHNLHKQRGEALIVQHFSSGVHLLFLQELNETPRCDLLPPGSFVQALTGHHRNGVAIIGHPEIAPFLSPFPLPDNPGLLVGATLHIPPLPPILLLSIYAGQGTRPLLERLILPLLHKPLVILAGDFNSPFSPLDVDNMHFAPWPLFSTLLSSAPPPS